MKTEKVSIIMPVYNSELFLKDAIESIFNQTYSNLELIAVDDGSTDDSLDLLQKISKKDSRLKVYHKKNGGISSARNFGIEKASGKYIAFIDNDDTYDKNLIKDNVGLLEKYNAEMVKFNKTKVYIGTNIKETTKMNFNTIFLKNNEIWENFDKINKFGGTIWNGIYLSKFLKNNNILFDESSRNVIEDHRFNIDCYDKVSKIVLNSTSYYNWNMRIEHSTTGKFIYERFDNIKIQANDLYRMLERKNINALCPNFVYKLKLSYLVNIILVINYDNSNFNYIKFKNYMKNLKKYDLFKVKINRSGYLYLKEIESKLRIFLLFLFDNNLYFLIYIFSKIKMKYDIKKKNRRF